MKDLIKRQFSLLRRRERGFTLVELLVVVGIIVALGAVIVPNVLQFASSGTTGAQAAEADNVQTAIDSYMADNATTTVAANVSPNNSTNNFSGTGVLDLTGYIRSTTTTYFYCWDANGTILAQHATATACP